MNTNQCPHCQTILKRVNVEVVDMQLGDSHRKGFTYACPMCHSVLGMQMDPIPLLNNFKEEVIRELCG